MRKHITPGVVPGAIAVFVAMSHPAPAAYLRALAERKAMDR